MKYAKASLAKFLSLSFLVLNQSVYAESFQINNQDLFNMVNNPAPELETDCFECTKENSEDLVINLKNKIKPDWQNIVIPKFCEDVGSHGFAEFATEMTDQELSEKINKNDFNFLNEKNKYGYDRDSWLMSLSPSYNLRLANHNNILHFNSNKFKWPELSPIDKQIPKNVSISEFISNLPESDPRKNDWPDDPQSEFARHQDDINKYGLQQVDDFNKADKAKLVLCAKYGIANIKKCASNLSKIVETMKPRFNMTLFPLIKEVLSDPIYTKASQKIALRIQNKVENKGVPSGNLFEDIYQSFIELGTKPDEAEERSFNLLAVISMGGITTPTKIMRFITKKTAPFYYSLAIIETGTTVLNHVSKSTGHIYAYPDKVTGGCDNGKPYHFWMAAYLARKTAQESDDINSAISSTYLAHLGYQMMAQTSGRYPEKPFTVETYDNGNNKIRMDLALAGAGAVYGASIGAKKPLNKNLNIDEGLRELLKEAGHKKVLSNEEAKKKWQGSGASGYFLWRSIFAPDSSLDIYKKSLRK